MKKQFAMDIGEGVEIVLRGNVKRFIERELPGKGKGNEEIIHASYCGADKDDYELVIRRRRVLG